MLDDHIRYQSFICASSDQNMVSIQGITTGVLLVAVVAISSVYGQTDSFITPTERELRANLTRLVQFVIHPSATPSMDLINYALVSGGEPKTQEERMVYLRMMKTIARNTPEFMKKFTTTTTLPGGLKSDTVDEMGIDAHITSRAMQYVQKQAEILAAAVTGSATNSATKSATTSTVASTVSNSNETPLVSGAVTETSMNSQPSLTQQVDGSSQVAVQDLHQNKLIPAADGTVSLADVFNFINSYNAQNQMNPQQF